MNHKRNRYWALALFVLVISASLLTGRALAQTPIVEVTYTGTLPEGWERMEYENNLFFSSFKFPGLTNGSGASVKVWVTFSRPVSSAEFRAWADKVYEPRLTGPIETGMYGYPTLRYTETKEDAGNITSQRDEYYLHLNGGIIAIAANSTCYVTETISIDDCTYTRQDIAAILNGLRIVDLTPSAPAAAQTGLPWQVIIDLGGFLGAGVGALTAGSVLAGAVNNILSINREKRKKAAQDSQKELQEQDPNEVIGYILQLSSDAVMLTPKQPASVNAAVWQVTADGATARATDAAIRVDVPGTAAGSLQVTPVSAQGQITCTFSQIGQAGQDDVMVTFNASAAQGGASALVRVSFDLGLAIFSNQPVIRYSVDEKRWVTSGLAVYFCTPGGSTPIRAPFKYGFSNPNAICSVDPDILNQEEAYSPDDGLTWQVKLKLKDEINLEDEALFGKDLTKNDGKVTIKVTAVRDDQQTYTATTSYQLRPEAALFVYSCFVQDPRNRSLDKRPYQNTELGELELVADGMDKLELGAVFLRTDKVVEPGNEYAERLSVATITQMSWRGTEESWGFNPPEVDLEQSGDDCFGYRISTSRPLLATSENLGKKPILHFEAALKPKTPPNYAILASSLDVQIKPQCLYLRLIVTPGEMPNQSEAGAYVSLAPQNQPLAGAPLLLEVTEGENMLRILKSPENNATDLEGHAQWLLGFQNLTFEKIKRGEAKFKVRCGICEPDGSPPLEATYVCFDLNENLKLYLDALTQAADTLRLTNPYWQPGSSSYLRKGVGLLWRDIWTGSVTNILSLWQNGPFGFLNEYTCGQIRDRIWEWSLAKRRFGRDLEICTRMNGLDFVQYEIPMHTFFGFYPSGNENDARFIDPWWTQAFDPEYAILTRNDERLKLTEVTAELALVAAATAAILGAAGYAATIVGVQGLFWSLLGGAGAVSGAAGWAKDGPCEVTTDHPYKAANGGYRQYQSTRRFRLPAKKMVEPLEKWNKA